jgi:hypothetical protein
VTPVSLHVWQVPPAAVPKAMWHLATRRTPLRRLPGVRFAKLLGTGRGSEFGPGAADLTRWATLVAWEPGTHGTPPLTGSPFTTKSVNRVTLLSLQPLASRGTWAGLFPFEPMPRDAATAYDGPILVLTRARLRLATAPTFWRSIGPVARTLPEHGLLAAFGVGEAPLGFQGTVSVWRSAADIAQFAYRRAEHSAVVARTGQQRWYVEELFARFAVLDVTGDREVIGWKTSR